jgi:hypothetical protein
MKTIPTYYKFYTKKNFIWEDKGIILGLIYYITKNYYNFKNKTIQIKHKLYCEILNKLFKNINFNETKGILFNIKNNCNDTLCINYLDNLNNITYKTLYILPWNNYDNPLVLVDKGSKKIDIKEIKDKITHLKYYSSKKYPYLFDDVNEINQKFCMNNKSLEHYILHKFSKHFTKKISYKRIRRYINKKLVPVSEDTLYYPVYQYNGLTTCPSFPQQEPTVQTITQTIPVKEKYDFKPLFNSISHKLESINDFVKK